MRIFRANEPLPNAMELGDYYPEDDGEYCEHGVHQDDVCEACKPWCACGDAKVEEEGQFCEQCAYEALGVEL